MATDREQYIEGLRQLATILEEHPEIGLPINAGADQWTTVTIYCGTDDPREAVAAAARAFPCTWKKSTSGDGDKWLDLTGQLAGLHVQLYAAREAVCTRRVVGTEEREVEEEVTPAVTRTVTKTVDVVEWDCGPILAAKPPATHCPICSTPLVDGKCPQCTPDPQS